jgi:hypothetical protein
MQKNLTISSHFSTLMGGVGCFDCFDCLLVDRARLTRKNSDKMDLATITANADAVESSWDFLTRGGLLIVSLV